MNLRRINVFLVSNLVACGLFLFPSFASQSEAVTWEKLVDFGDPGYSETSRNWDTYTYGPSPGGSYRYLSRLLGDHTRTGTANWTTVIPFNGIYQVSVSCRKTENRTTDADYYVTNNDKGLDHFSVNQNDHRNILVWDTLGQYVYEKGQTVRVFLDGRDDGSSDCADAAVWKLVRLTPETRLLTTKPVDIGPIVSFLLKKN